MDGEASGALCEGCGEAERGAGHWCAPVGQYVGDPTLGSLLFEMEFGPPAPEDAA